MGGPAQAAGVTAGGRFGSGFAGAVKKFALVAGAGFAAAGVGLFKVGEVFDDVTDTIRVGTGATGDALNGLVQSARNVGRDVPASFGQIGTVIADLNTRLGLTGPTLETLSKQLLEAGRILGEEINVQQVTGAFSAFRIEGEDTTTAMDTLFQVSQATGVGINDLAARLSKQGTIVAQLGFSFEDAAALLGILNKAGVDGNAVFASMQAGLVRLSKDGEAPADAFKRVTGEIQTFLDAGNDAAAIDLAGQAFGTRGAGQLISALKSGKLNFEDMASAAGLSGDSILEVSEDTADLAEKFQIFKNRALLALEPIATRVFDALGRGMQWVNDVAAPAFGRFADVAEQRLAPAAAQLGDFFSTKVVPALRQVGAFIMQSVIPGLIAFWERLQALAVTLRPVVAQIVDFAKQVIAVAVPALQQIGSMIVDRVMPALQRFFEAAQPILSWLIETIGPILLNAFNGLVQVVKGALNIIVGVLDFFVALFTGNWSGMWEAIKDIASGVWQVIQGAFQYFMNTGIMLVAQVVLAALGKAFSAAWTWIQNITATLWAVIVAAWNGISSGISAAWNWINTNVVGPFIARAQAIWDKVVVVKDGIVGAFNLIRDGVGAAYTWIRDNAIDPLISGFQAAWDKADEVKEGIVGAFDSVKTSITDIFEDVVEGVKAPIRALLRFINSNIIDKLNWVTEKFGFEIPKIPIGFNRGGVIPGGGPDRDTVIAAMTPGEGVLTRRTTQALGGRAAIDALNSGGVNLAQIRRAITGSFDTGPRRLDLSRQFAKDMLAAIRAGKRIQEDYAFQGMSDLYSDQIRYGTARRMGVTGIADLSWAARASLLQDHILRYLQQNPADSTLRSSKPLMDWGLAQGGPSIGDIWDALTGAADVGALPGWAAGALDAGEWAADGVKRVLGAAMDLAISAANGLGGPAIPMGLFRSWLTLAKEKILSWGEKQDNQLAGFSKEVGGTLEKGGWLTPLRVGTYRVGRGTAGHGYPAQDLPSPIGTSVLAAQSGRIAAVRHMNTSYGNHIRVNHPGGFQTLYAHLSSTLGTSIGESIRRGGLLGRVGSTGNSTGPHLHLEILSGGRRLDPARYFKFDSGMGVLPTGHSLVYNGTGGPEPLVDPRRFDTSGGSPRVQITTLGTPQDMVNQVVWRIRMDDLSTQLPLGG